MENILAAAIGGLIVVFFDGFVVYYKALKSMDLRTSMIYYDLQSIKNYFEETSGKISNVRYSKIWHENLAHCDFFDSEVVKEIYYIYDNIYNFNETFDSKTVYIKDSSEFQDYKVDILPRIDKVLDLIKREYPEFEGQSSGRYLQFLRSFKLYLKKVSF